jgi:hypothetical protein
MPSRANAIRTPQLPRAGKNISGFYQKKLGSQMVVRMIEQLGWAASFGRLAFLQGRGENCGALRFEIEAVF